MSPRFALAALLSLPLAACGGVVPPATSYTPPPAGPPASAFTKTGPLMGMDAKRLTQMFGTPRLDNRLKEIHFGDWEGRSFDDIGSAIDDWAADPLGFRAPGGESPREMATRVLQWLEVEIRDRPQLTDHLVVVAHGGPLRAIAGHLLGMPPERWLGLDFGCGQVTRIDVESWGVVLKWFNR